jgi:hypothetical protein
MRAIQCFGGVEYARDVQKVLTARMILPEAFTSSTGYPQQQGIPSARFSSNELATRTVENR